MEWSSLFPTFIGAATGGIAVYIGIREDLAVLKAQNQSNKEKAEAAHARAEAAHNRIDRMNDK
jgi:hypothetical protein